MVYQQEVLYTSMCSRLLKKKLIERGIQAKALTTM